ncbi:MAG: hypothetical protein Q9167_003274 [Letrouitia subvulpina]
MYPNAVFAIRLICTTPKTAASPIQKLNDSGVSPRLFILAVAFLVIGIPYFEFAVIGLISANSSVLLILLPIRTADMFDDFEFVTTTIDVHDIRPPPGVDVVSLDSIKLLLKFVPSTGPDNGFKRRREKATHGETITFSDPCLASLKDEVDAEMLLGLGFRGPHAKGNSVTVCGAKEHLGKLSATDANPLLENGISSQRYQHTNKAVKRPRASSITSLTDLDLRLLVRLVDASLRLALGGSYVVQRGDLISSAPGIKIHHYGFDQGLADIAPALFRPGYLPAIAHRSPFIPSIASSLTSILSQNKFRHPQSSAPSFLGLQAKLWRLLAKKDWPREQLRPLNCTFSAPFEQAAEGVEILDGNINAREASQLIEEDLLNENLFDYEEDILFEVGTSTQENWVSLESEIAVGDGEPSLLEEEWVEWSQNRDKEFGNGIEDGELLL